MIDFSFSFLFSTHTSTSPLTTGELLYALTSAKAEVEAAVAENDDDVDETAARPRAESPADCGTSRG
jgi:hypothetical protein